MSTKIWEAYEVKRGHDPWNTLMDIKRKATAAVKRDLVKLYDKMIAAPEAELWPEVKDWGEASRYVRKQYAASMVLPNDYSNIWQMDICLTVRKSGRRCLVIPYGSGVFLPNALKFLEKHPALADFHYQNQTDRSNRGSAREWNTRRRVWEPLLGHHEWQDYMTIEIMSINRYSYIDPAWDYKLMKKRLKSEARLSAIGPSVSTGIADSELII